jgi:hypothetical protein
VRLVTARDDLREINSVLDEVESTRDPERHRERLEQALRASRRALTEFIQDGDLAETLRQARRTTSAYTDDIDSVTRDAMLFGAFVTAERRLLSDLGLDASAIDRLIAEIRDIPSSGDSAALPVDPDRVDEGLLNLRNEVDQWLDRVHAQPTSGDIDSAAPRQVAESRRVLRRVFLVVGGVVVVAANALIGAPASPVTGGLSVVGAAVSTNMGAGLIGAGITGLV